MGCYAGLMKEHGKAMGSVAVLSSYKAQVTALRSHFQRVHGAAKMASVEFATIDGFQVFTAQISQMFFLTFSVLRRCSCHNPKNLCLHVEGTRGGRGHLLMREGTRE